MLVYPKTHASLALPSRWLRWIASIVRSTVISSPRPISALYGVADYWTIPTSKGDCEDYALLKRQILMRAGWPASALLMTVVVDEHHEGHAVLTARTARGDYILDNKTDELRLWHQTPYEFLMRQSYLDPRIWMSLDPEKAMTSVPVGEPRRR